PSARQAHDRPTTGSSTWVVRHPWQMARRGRIRRSRSPSRSLRARANHHGRSSPSQRGQARRPPTRSLSTATWSTPTMSIGASHHRKGPPVSLDRRGGPLRVRVAEEVELPREEGQPEGCPPSVVIKLDVALRGLCPHFGCRPTASDRLRGLSLENGPRNCHPRRSEAGLTERPLISGPLSSVVEV